MHLLNESNIWHVYKKAELASSRGQLHNHRRMTAFTPWYNEVLFSYFLDFVLFSFFNFEGDDEVLCFLSCLLMKDVFCVFVFLKLRMRPREHRTASGECEKLYNYPNYLGGITTESGILCSVYKQQV